MTVGMRRRLILVFAFAAAVHVFFNVVGIIRNGDFGAEYVAVGTKDRPAVRITNVTAPNSFSPPVHVGEVFVLWHSLSERLRSDNSGVGDGVVMYRSDGQPVIAVQQWAPPNFLKDISYPVFQLAMFVIAALVVSRRGERVEARTLASFLIWYGCGDAGQSWPFLPDWTYLFHTYVGNVATVVAFAQAARFATLFPDSNAGGVRALIRRITPAITTVPVAASLYAITSDFAFNHWSGPAETVSNVSFDLAFAYYAAAIATSFWIANIRATGVDVGRVRWVSYSIGSGLPGIAIGLGASFAGFNSWWLNIVFYLSFLVIPTGLGYAVLRHRVIDVGFVITRALVFGAVSLLVLLSFLLVEWFLTKVLLDRNHVTSGAVEALAALVLGVSLRSIHRRVEGVADRIFFRTRHHAEASLRQFSREVLYITEQRTIYDRTIATVTEYADAAAAIYVFDRKANAYQRVGGATPLPESVDANDVIFVRLRMLRSTMHVHELRSVLSADLACPIIVRGDVVGALVCAGKRSGEAYAPDEVEILSEVARSVGVASDGVYTQKLRDELDRIRAEYAALVTVVKTYDAR